jgi:hypothetical protein
MSCRKPTLSGVGIGGMYGKQFYATEVLVIAKHFNKNKLTDMVIQSMDYVFWICLA